MKLFLAKQKSVLDESDPEIAMALRTLAYNYSMQKRYDEAEILFKQYIAKQKSLLGESNSPDLIETMSNYASNCSEQGKH